MAAATATTVVAPSAATSPNPAAENDLDDFSDTADWEWNLAQEAEGADFEIDADATSFFMPQGNVVTFKAVALNGTPPFAYSWDFRDGTPPKEGAMVKHVFVHPERYTVRVIGKDASGATSIVDLGVLVLSHVDYGIRRQEDPKVIEELRARFASPSPAATP